MIFEANQSDSMLSWGISDMNDLVWGQIGKVDFPP
jgi:hypothetical protein